MYVTHDVKEVDMARVLNLVTLKMMIYSTDYVSWQLCHELGKILLNLKCFNVRNI